MNPFISCTLLVAVVCSVSGNNYGGSYTNKGSSGSIYQSNSHQPPPQQYSEQQSYSTAPAKQQYQQQTYSQQPAQQYQSSAPVKQNSYSQQSNSASGYQQPETIKITIAGGSSNSYAQPQSSSSYRSSASAPSTYGGSSYGSSSSSYGSSSTKSNEAGASIIRHNQNIQPGHSYQFDYATSNGIQHSELTTVNAPTTPGGWGSITKTGQYSYTSPEGQPISLTYQADEGGFKAKGAHLPVAPVDPNHSKSNSYSAAGSPSSGGYSSYNNQQSTRGY